MDAGYFLLALLVLAAFGVGLMLGWAVRELKYQEEKPILILQSIKNGWQEGWNAAVAAAGASTALQCAVCKKEIAQCGCSDIDERLRALRDQDGWQMQWCTVCDKHKARCQGHQAASAVVN